jgi:hypothetical protein
VRAGLDANTVHHLTLGSARFVLQEEIVFKKGKVWEDGKVSFVEMNEGCYLMNAISIQMGKFNFAMVE